MSSIISSQLHHNVQNLCPSSSRDSLGRLQVYLAEDDPVLAGLVDGDAYLGDGAPRGVEGAVGHAVDVEGAGHAEAVRRGRQRGGQGGRGGGEEDLYLGGGVESVRGVFSVAAYESEDKNGVVEP